MYERDWWELYKSDDTAKAHLFESLLYKSPLRENILLKTIKNGGLFSFVQGDTDEPENLKENLSQSGGRLISSYFLQNARTITPLLLF